MQVEDFDTVDNISEKKRLSRSTPLTCHGLSQWSRVSPTVETSRRVYGPSEEDRRKTNRMQYRKEETSRRGGFGGLVPPELYSSDPKEACSKYVSQNCRFYTFWENLLIRRYFAYLLHVTTTFAKSLMHSEYQMSNRKLQVSEHFCAKHAFKLCFLTLISHGSAA